jgi:hypothetical protein
VPRKLDRSAEVEVGEWTTAMCGLCLITRRVLIVNGPYQHLSFDCFQGLEQQPDNTRDPTIDY